jgi:hypothetical protein
VSQIVASAAIKQAPLFFSPNNISPEPGITKEERAAFAGVIEKRIVRNNINNTPSLILLEFIQ